MAEEDDAPDRRLSTVNPIRMKDGTILVPTRAESDDGSMVGDTMLPLTPEHPLYEDWEKRIGQHPDQVQDES